MSDKHYEIESQHNLDNNKTNNSSTDGLSLVEILKNNSPEAKSNLPRLTDKNENASPSQLEFPNIESLTKQVKNAIDKTPNNTQALPNLKSILDQIKEGSVIPKEGDKAWEEHKTLIKELLEANEKPLDDQKIREYAKSIAAIIGKNDDFAYGGRNEKIQNLLGEAAKAGEESFNKLIKQLNKELEAKGLKVSGKMSVSNDTELLSTGSIVLTSYPPIYQDAKVRHTKTAQVDLTLTSKSGAEEDTLKFRKVISDVTRRESYREPLDSELSPNIRLKRIKDGL